MEREILFRGKRVDNGKWVEGYYFKATLHWHEKGIHEDWIATRVLQNGGWCNVISRHAVIPETVGQYVGVEDINKKKIYEYDRVKCKGVETLGTVLFDGGGFGVEFDEPIAEDWTSTALYCLINEEGFAECEVIGTVFDKESDNGD